jgi:hypothetical protein
MQHERVDCRAVVALHAIGVIAWGIASPAIGQAPVASEPAAAALHVQSPAGCLESSAIESQVRQRSQRVTFVPAEPSVPRLNVELQRKSPRSLTVELRVSWPDKRRSSRRIAANSCEEATSAVAFLIALTLDPAAFTQTGTGPGAEPAATHGTEEAARGTVATDAAAATAPAKLAPDSGLQTSGSSGERVSDSTTRTNADAASRANTNSAEPQAHEPEPIDTASDLFALDYIGLGLSAQLSSGAAPSVMPGLRVHAMLALRGSGWFAPALQLSAAHVWASALKQSGGVADFQRTTVRLDLCPLAIRAGALAARACLSSAVGSSNAQGSESFSPRSSARGWFDLGATLLANADLGPIFQVIAGFTLTAPLRRDRFAFQPDVFYRVAALGWDGHLGMGVRFP